MRFLLPGLSALLVLVMVGCEGGGRPTAMGDAGSLAEGGARDRLSALEAQVAEVGLKRAWSGRYFQGRVVQALVPDGPDLYAAVFNPETRESEVHCVELRTGVPRWILVLGTVPLKFPPKGGERFVACILDQGAGAVVAYRRNGARAFTMATPIHVLPSNSAASSDTTLYIASLVDSRIHAVGPESGRSGWHFRTDGTIVAGPLVTPRLPRRMVVAGTDSGEVVAVPATPWNEPGPRAPIWRKRLLGEVHGDITIAERITPAGVEVSLLVPCEDGGLYCLDVATGEPRWVARTESAFMGRPRAAGDRAYARNAGRLVAVDLASGQPVWPSGYERGQLRDYETCTDVLAGDEHRVYLLSGNRRVHRADPRTGDFQASRALELFDFVVPAPEGNLLLAGTADGYLVASH
jgi:outer membrane protein assembly factor BamB